MCVMLHFNGNVTFRYSKELFYSMHNSIFKYFSLLLDVGNFWH